MPKPLFYTPCEIFLISEKVFKAYRVVTSYLNGILAVGPRWELIHISTTLEETALLEHTCPIHHREDNFHRPTNFKWVWNPLQADVLLLICDADDPHLLLILLPQRKVIAFESIEAIDRKLYCHGDARELLRFNRPKSRPQTLRLRALLMDLESDTNDRSKLTSLHTLEILPPMHPHLSASHVCYSEENRLVFVSGISVTAVYRNMDHWRKLERLTVLDGEAKYMSSDWLVTEKTMTNHSGVTMTRLRFFDMKSLRMRPREFEISPAIESFEACAICGDFFAMLQRSPLEAVIVSMVTGRVVIHIPLDFLSIDRYSETNPSLLVLDDQTIAIYFGSCQIYFVRLSPSSE